MSENKEPQLIAFTAIVDEHGYKIGLCHQGIRGYSPTKFGPYKTYEEYNNKAKELNEGLGLTTEMAYAIIASTMRHEPPKYVLGKIEVSEETDSDIIERITDILNKAEITYDEDYPWILIRCELPEGRDLTNPPFYEIQEILRKNKLFYEIDVQEYQPTPNFFKDSWSPDDEPTD